MKTKNQQRKTPKNESFNMEIHNSSEKLTRQSQVSNIYPLLKTINSKWFVYNLFIKYN